MMRVLRNALVILAAAATTLTAVACSKDKEVLAMASDFETFSGEIVKKMKAAPNPAAGVAAAQEYLDANKARVREELGTIKSVKNFQISDETRKKIESAFTKGATAVAGLQLEYVAQMATDAKFRAAMEKLVQDYRDVVAN
jgi:hypothetical protein